MNKPIKQKASRRKTVSISFFLPPQWLKDIRAKAKANDLTVSQYMRRLLAADLNGKVLKKTVPRKGRKFASG